jgi:phospholipase/lecithinase/hemolysin
VTAGPAPADPITGMVVFGDSLSDAGNASAATGGHFPPAPYSDGRFSNGPIWVQHLAGQLGVTSPTPSLLGGTDYAIGGATTGSTPLDAKLGTPAGYAPLMTPSGQFITNVPTLQTQVAGYIASLGGGKISPGTLVTVWAGANDFFDGQTNPLVPAKNVANAVSSLIGAGAKNLLVAYLPDLSKTPFGLGSPPSTQQGLAALSAGFNHALGAELSLLGSVQGVTIHTLDTVGLLQQIQGNPARYGFTNVTGEGILTGNPAAPGYLFWDDVHPTTAGHAVIAGQAFATLSAPEPSGATLAVLGVLGLLCRARRRKPAA